ncbi:hypothetical protein PGT21_011747 [Puccinia graminis f. sp. tritici]|uniref:Uncharacterized protein n=1 Tax=Puccinia graminis f. sp. tritici TaxID=56615 RepID=A0A5B0NXY7_PUCGR|nr:hypothetical protein PGTUg99_029955 [Puccinia graminis f. sp. tritici]KAA1094157.1 hypothetical protein PGT21_011747 [Puccinia graminis f. sp. tritici]
MSNSEDTRSTTRTEAGLRAMTSADVVTSILESLIPPECRSSQAWLASLATVHPSWTQPVSLALRRHPILSSISQLLGFQDSLVDHLMISLDSGAPGQDRPKPKISPSACALRSLIINLAPTQPTTDSSTHIAHIASQERLTRQLQLSKEMYLDPGFFGSLSSLRSMDLSMLKLSLTNFRFLLASLASSLAELGLHDLCIIGAVEQDTLPIFQAIFGLPRLIALRLTGRLATSRSIFRLLIDPSNQLGLAGRALETLALSDQGLTSLGGEPMLMPHDLLHCWKTSLIPYPRDINLENGLSVSTESAAPTRYPDDRLQVLNYRVSTNAPEWHVYDQPDLVKEAAKALGLRLTVSHHSDPIERIKWMSRSP